MADPEERWVPVFGHERLYEISETGAIRRTAAGGSSRVGRLVKSRKRKLGYVSVVLSDNSVRHEYLVHRLVLSSFVSAPMPGHQCDHIDGIRHNNHVSNLRWLTPSENQVAASLRRGGLPNIRGEKNYQAKLNATQVRIIRSILPYKVRADGIWRLLADAWGVSMPSLCDVIARRTWRHVQ